MSQSRSTSELEVDERRVESRREDDCRQRKRDARRARRNVPAIEPIPSAQVAEADLRADHDHGYGNGHDHRTVRDQRRAGSRCEHRDEYLPRLADGVGAKEDAGGADYAERHHRQRRAAQWMFDLSEIPHVLAYQLLDDDEDSLQPSPDDKGPCRAVPQTDQQKGDEQLARPRARP